MITPTQSWLNYNALPNKQRVTLISFSIYTRVFTTQVTQVGGQVPWINSISGGGLKVDDFNGWAQRGGLTVTVVDVANQISNDLAGLTDPLDGQTVTIKSGFVGMSQSQFVTLLTMQVEKVDVGDEGNTYEIQLRDLGIELNYPVYLTADDSWPTSSRHTKSILMNPMDLINDVLVNQIGYSSGRLNATSLAYYKAQLFPGLELSFTLDLGPQAQDFLNTEIFKALYGYGFWNSLGQYTPHFFAAQPSASPVMDLYDGVNVPGLGFKSGLGTPIQSPLPVFVSGDYYTIMSYDYDYNGQNFESELVTASADSPPDLSRQQKIQAKGLLSPIGGGLYARLVANTLFQRYGSRPSLLRPEIDWTGVLIEPGDLVYVTHPQIKLKGVIGLVYEIMEVQGTETDWEKGTVTLDLLDTPWLEVGPYEIAPHGTAAWTSGGAATPYMFISSGTPPKYSDGTIGRVLYP